MSSRVADVLHGSYIVIKPENKIEVVLRTTGTLPCETRYTMPNDMRGQVDTCSGRSIICVMTKQGSISDIRIDEGENPIMKMYEMLEDLVRIGSYDLNEEQRCFMDEVDRLLERNEYGRDRKMESKDYIYGLIEQADKCRDEIVLCLLGQPGIGKTEAVERYARDHGRNVVHIITSQILPNEVSGITMPDKDTRSMDIFDHYRLAHMRDGDILFFDELLQGQQQVLSACLTLIQERRLMSGKKLPDVLIIAASNPLASPTIIRPEIRQRFMFVDVEWDRESWISYMVSNGFIRSEHLEKLATRLSNELSGKDPGEWNILTPRTATKLCRWMKRSGDNKFVTSYIDDTFGRDVRSMILSVVNAEDIEAERREYIDAVKSQVLNIVHVHCGEGGDEIKEKIESTFDAMSSNSKDNDGLADIFDMLSKLPEWDEISKELEDISIDTDIIYNDSVKF